jgi:hypothetical protein
MVLMADRAATGIPPPLLPGFIAIGTHKALGSGNLLAADVHAQQGSQDTCAAGRL